MKTKTEIMNHVYHNCDTKEIRGKWHAFITLCGYDFTEEGITEQHAKDLLAVELSESKFIQANFKK